MPWKMKKVNDTDILEIGGDGNPIWIDDKGKEASVNAARIPELMTEAAKHRREKEAAEAKLQAFGDLDPTKAREAIEKLQLVDQGQLVAAGKVEEVRAALKAELQAKLDAKDAELNTIKTEAKNDKLAAAFAGSEFIKSKMGFGSDLVQQMLGKHFDVKDGKVVAIDANGNPVSSQKTFGELASFDEALEAIVMQRADKDHLLRGVQGGGTGGDTNGGVSGVKRTLTRAQEAALPLAEKVAFHNDVNAGTAKLVD
jgi:hypothetical protein